MMLILGSSLKAFHKDNKGSVSCFSICILFLLKVKNPAQKRNKNLVLKSHMLFVTTAFLKSRNFSFISFLGNITTFTKDVCKIIFLDVKGKKGYMYVEGKNSHLKRT